ncbi:MAG: TPR end-of-group domain-containing protein [Thermoanaerobaculia bacterium]
MRRFVFLLLLATSLAGAEPERGKLVENIASRLDPTQTYTLYLPTTYDSMKQQPLLYVFDPRGRATFAAEIFKDAAEHYGWIVISSNQTRSDDDGVANARAVRALLPEMNRYAIHPRRIYAAGFSGTAILSCAIGIHTGAFAGVIAVGGRLAEHTPPAKFSFAHYGFAGDSDFNNREMRAIDEMLEREGKTHRFQQFAGQHQWFPPELAREAIDWMELLAMKAQLRPRDASLIAKLYAADIAAANALTGVNALRRYREIARTYEGLHATDDAVAAMQRLENDPEVRRERKEIAKWDEFEIHFLDDVQKRSPAEFRVSELQRRAKRQGAEGATARRLLEGLYAQTSFYLPRQLMETHQYELAATVLRVAIQIHDDRWPAWYNLAAAQARGGDRRRALDSLEKAVAAGFRDRPQLLADEDLASLRNEPRFQALLASRSQ